MTRLQFSTWSTSTRLQFSWSMLTRLQLSKLLCQKYLKSKSFEKKKSFFRNFFNGQRRPSCTFLMVDVDHPALFHRSTSTYYSFNCCRRCRRRSTLSTSVNVSTSIFTAFFITPGKSRKLLAGLQYLY